MRYLFHFARNFLLASLLVLSLTACGGGDDSNSSTSINSNNNNWDGMRWDQGRWQ